MGVDVDEAVNSGKLTIAGQEDMYLRNGHCEPDKIIHFWADTLKPAMVSGFSGLRVVGEGSIKTVEAHRSQIMNRLDIHDVSGLVRFAIRAGLVSP